MESTNKIVDHNNLNTKRFVLSEESSLDNKKQLFCCFCSLFWIYYYPWIRSKPEQLQCREDYFIKRLMNILNVSADDQFNLISVSKEMSKKFRKLLKIKFLPFFNDSTEHEAIQLKVECNQQNLSIELNFKEENTEIFFEVDQVSYENNESIMIKTNDNEVCIHILPSDVGFTELTERFVSKNADIVFNLSFDWIVDEHSCESMIENPRLIVYYFSAILLELGSRYWKMFRVMHKVLADSTDQTVLRLILASLHELSAVLKKSDTLNDLMPLFARFLDTKQNIIETSFLQNSVIFFRDLSRSHQILCLKLIPQFIDSDDEVQCQLKKLLISKKILNLLIELNESEIAEHVVSLAIEMLKSEQKDAAKSGTELYCAAVHELVKQSNGEISDLLSDVLTCLVQQLATNQCTRFQNTFANVCEKLVSDNVLSPEILDQHLNTDCVLIMNRNEHFNTDIRQSLYF